MTLFKESPQRLIVRQKEVKDEGLEEEVIERLKERVLNGVGDIFGVLCLSKVCGISVINMCLCV